MNARTWEETKAADPRSPDLLAAIAAGRRDAAELLVVLDDPRTSPAKLQRAADRARQAMNELWSLASCDVRRRSSKTTR